MYIPPISGCYIRAIWAGAQSRVSSPVTMGPLRATLASSIFRCAGFETVYPSRSSGDEWRNSTVNKIFKPGICLQGCKQSASGLTPTDCTPAAPLNILYTMSKSSLVLGLECSLDLTACHQRLLNCSFVAHDPMTANARYSVLLE